MIAEKVMVNEANTQGFSLPILPTARILLMEVICWIVNTMSVTPHILNAQIIIVFHGGGFAIRSGIVRVGQMRSAALTENHVQDNTNVMNRVCA